MSISAQSRLHHATIEGRRSFKGVHLLPVNYNSTCSALRRMQRTARIYQNKRPENCIAQGFKNVTEMARALPKTLQGMTLWVKTATKGMRPRWL